MKKIISIASFSFIIFLFGCNKNMSKSTELSKSDILFTQVKNDPLFWDYLNTINCSMKIVRNDIRNGKVSDSLILQDKNKTIEEKFKTLNYTGLDSVKNEIGKSKELFSSLSIKYPLILNLSKDESKLFFKEVYAYFYKEKIK